MARPPTIEDDALIGVLAGVFRDVGYEAASLAHLAEAAGLQKASLYHRFPGGKAAMAAEVLARATDWLGREVIAPLTEPGDPRARIGRAAAALDGFYQGGRKACLLNMLSSPRPLGGPFSAAIRSAMLTLIAALAAPARDAGQSAEAAQARAERALGALQGALVLSRGLGDDGPWRRALPRLADDLTGDAE